MKIRMTRYRCEKCDDGMISVRHIETKFSGTFEVKKCDNCRHQYYFKESIRSLKKIEI